MQLKIADLFNPAVDQLTFILIGKRSFVHVHIDNGQIAFKQMTVAEYLKVGRGIPPAIDRFPAIGPIAFAITPGLIHHRELRANLTAHNPFESRDILVQQKVSWLEQYIRKAIEVMLKIGRLVPFDR
jgi:hypothetical protein